MQHAPLLGYLSSSPKIASIFLEEACAPIWCGTLPLWFRFEVHRSRADSFRDQRPYRNCSYEHELEKYPTEHIDRP